MSEGNVKIGPSPTTPLIQGLYMHGIAARAASLGGLVWVVKGLVCKGFQVRFQGEPPLLMVSVSNEIQARTGR